MNNIQVPYSEYGKGQQPMLAFHGYGMDGNQFKVLETSLCTSHRIFGFHMPFHKYGPPSDDQWIFQLIEEIKNLFPEKSDRFSLLGYSIGSKVAIKILEAFPAQVDEVILCAPYGLEPHVGLDFVTRGWGNSLFKNIVTTRWPERIMKAAHKSRIINTELKDIILEEMDTEIKRLNLCLSLKMIGQIQYKEDTVSLFNRNKITCKLIYGTSDFLFPFHKRNRKLASQIELLEVLSVQEGHWLVTELLDQSIAKMLKVA